MTVGEGPGINQKTTPLYYIAPERRRIEYDIPIGTYVFGLWRKREI